ncbi:MAG: MXAN_5808 family serine peptidase [Myxococcota bacterium]|nr:MXAN_5808 family serine peptidase [Myxococcota bacterium]
MRINKVLLFTVAVGFGWAGYKTSVKRHEQLPIDREVVATAGARPGVNESPFGVKDNGKYRLSRLSVFSNVALHVKDNYVDPARIDPKEMLKGALNEIEKEIAEVLVTETKKSELKVSLPGHHKIVTVSDVESLWEINLKLREVFRFFEKYLPPQKDMRNVEYAAINGALATLDPHSILLKPEAFAEMKTSTKGEFGGLGIVISIRDAKLTIISPLDGTPASAAGLKAMDVISRIGDVSTVSMPIEEAVRMLRGAEGSKVTIWVERKGWPEARKYTLTRQRIKIESVESHLLDKSIGYVKIKNFQQNTGRDLDEHIEKLEKKSKGTLKGLVLDLRNNPGGLLDQAIRVSDKFLKSGDIVTTVGMGNRLREPKRAKWSPSDLDLPLIVLVNNGSASASEIVAGALQNLDRAVIMGQRTFGKGSVQVLYDFADKSALKLTIAQYLTPGDISIQSVGVAPDIGLVPAWIDKKGIRLYYKPKRHREKNLDKHLAQSKVASKQEQSKLTPWTSFPYLVETTEQNDESENKKEGEKAKAEKAEPAPAKFEPDYQVSFARDILAKAGRKTLKETRTAMENVLKERQKNEAEKLQKAIEKLEIDWTENPNQSSEAELNVDAKITLDGAETDGTLKAGSEIKVSAKLTNKGSEDLYRIHGHIETDHPAFRGREFLFGKISAGESVTREFTAKIPKEAASRADILELVIGSNGNKAGVKAKLAVSTQYIPHPQFSYSSVIDDSERGDGDGILEPGEGAELIVNVTNIGQGKADNVTLRLKSAAGEDLFLERGRIQIGTIESLATKAGRLKFRIRKNQTAGKKELPLELTIYDANTGEWLEDEFALKPSPKVPAKFSKKKGFGSLKKDAVLRAAAGTDAKVIATASKGDKLQWIGRLGSFLKVKLSDKSHAWIDEQNVRKRRGSKSSETLKTIEYHPERRPPMISLTPGVSGEVVTEEAIELSGTITARHLRDMYIVHDDQKIFFRSGPAKSNKNSGNKSEGWKPQDDKAVVFPFTTKLKLKEGLNKILVVARLDERIIAYRSVLVSRINPESTEVAQASNKKQ